MFALLFGLAGKEKADGWGTRRTRRTRFTKVASLGGDGRGHVRSALGLQCVSTPFTSSPEAYMLQLDSLEELMPQYGLARLRNRSASRASSP